MYCETLRRLTAGSVLLGIFSIGATTALGQPDSPVDDSSIKERSGQQKTDKPDAVNAEQRDHKGHESNSPQADQRRGWLGVDLLDAPDGVRIGSVVLGSPASKAGLRPGDRVVGVNGADMPTSASVVGVIGKLHAGDRVTIDVARAGEQLEINATLDARPASFDRGPLPLGSAPLRRALRPGTDVFAEMEEMRRRVESLEKQVESLRREISALRDSREKSGSKKEPAGPSEKAPPAAGAIELQSRSS